MAEGCSASLAKIVLIIINILFILSGLALIGIGVWMLADPYIKRYVDFIFGGNTTLFAASAGLLIAMGALVLIVAALGCAGACCEHKVVLGVYIALLTIIFAGEIAGGIIAIVYRDKIRREIDDTLRKSLATSLTWGKPYYEKYNASERCRVSEQATGWDLVQIEFDCCGINDGANSGYDSSNITEFCPQLSPLPRSRPVTCCKLTRPELKSEDVLQLVKDQKTLKNNYFDCNYYKTEGCVDSLVQFIEKYAPSLIGIGIGIGMFEMLVIIFAVCLCQHTSYKEEV